MSYAYTPYTPSKSVITKKKQQDTATNIYKNYVNTPYKQGVGGLGSQIGTAQQRLNTLYKNNNLSQQFKYGNQKQYDKALKNITSRKPFEYDLSKDTLFQQYKDNYQAMGKTAMADTIGQASSMTGGYGNSYATAAGAQTYNNYLQEINNSIGDFYNMALQGYNSETDRLNGVFGALSTDRSQQQSEWASNWDVYINLYRQYSDDYNAMLDSDIGLYKQRGDNLGNLANLYTSQYGTESSNDMNRWSSGENLKAEQGQQQLEQDKLNETVRANQASENIGALKAIYSSSNKKGNTLKATASQEAQKTIGLIRADMTDYRNRAARYKKAGKSIPTLEELTEKYIKKNKLTTDEARYVYYELGLLEK